MRSPILARTAIVLVILLGFGLRLLRLDDAPLRGDEAFSALYWAGLPLPQSLTEIATIEPHPVLTYVLFRAWGLFVGIDQPFALRLLPALLNLIGIAAMYRIGLALSGRRALGILAALLWAVQPFQVWHSQDFRNYAPWAGLSALSMALALRFMRYQRKRDWLLYTLLASATALLFYMEVFSLLVLSLYVLVVFRKQWTFLARWFVTAGIAGGSAAASFLILQAPLFARGGYGGTSLIFDASSLFSGFPPVLSFGEYYPPDFAAVLWPVLLIILIACFGLVLQNDRKLALLLGLWLLVPLILLSLIATRMNVFLPRYVMFSAPAYSLIFLSAILFFTQHSPSRRWGASIAVGAWLAVSGLGLAEYYGSAIERKASNWPALTAYLEANVEADALVIQTSIDAAFGYYYTSAAADTALPASPQQPREEIEQRLADAAEQYRSFWIVGQTFADWPNAGVVEAWTQAKLQQTRRSLISGLPVQEYRHWEVDATELRPEPVAQLGHLVEIVGFRIWSPSPDEVLTIWVYWRPLQASDSPLKAFVHLVGDINPASGTPLWTQDDHAPSPGNTLRWEAGIIYRDVFYLPLSGVTPGEYQVHAGLYDPESSERLITQNGTDHAVLVPEFTLP